ncbi:MAG: putative toxin-antitoxin system toxin component, PIN family [Elusimicrobia bacterium]|nr:putative toxin-antitoxin system toxin component, PIN family [Elusimicrobiota bacterium]
MISGLCFGGKPARILEQALTGRIHLFTSAVLIGEFKAVMDLKFPARTGAILDTLNELSQLWEVVPDAVLPTLRHVAADPADDRVLECAVAAQADYILSGDKHLLNLKMFGKIPILSPAGFLTQLGV